jgi:predicted DNA-binding WGR domain protein
VLALHVHEGGLHALARDAALYSLGESGTWRKIAEAPPGFVSRAHAAVAWSASGPKSAPERMYVLGGYPTHMGKFPADCFRWTPDAGWKSLEIAGKKPAFQHMLACWDPGRKVLVVVGGRDKRYTPNDLTFETDEKKWTSFPTQMEGGTAIGATLTYDAVLDKVLLLSTNEVRAYEGKGEWRLIGTMPAPSGGATEVAYDAEARTLYALGGTVADGFQRVALGALLDDAAARAPSAPRGVVEAEAPRGKAKPALAAKKAPEESSPAKRYLRSDEGGTDKFWFAELSGRSFQVRWGQRGTAGQTKVHELDDAAAARRAFDKKVAEKLDKGYWDAPEGERAAEIPGKTSYHWKLGRDGDDVAGGPSPVADVPACSGCENPMVHIVTLAAHPERLPLTKHAALSAYICANVESAGACPSFEAHGGANAVLLHRTLPAARKGDAPARKKGAPMVKAKRIAYTAQFEPDPEGDDADDLEMANKTGGHPAWYQFANVPACRVCTKPMRFVAQFSEFDEVLNFGGDGEAYVFVCSEEHEGALLWQCG